MKQSHSPFFTNYIYEVLGVKTYLCPEAVHSQRVLKGSLPCSVLAVVFEPLSPSRSELLKRIMASVRIFEFSTLEIKEEKVLIQLLCGEERLADFICFFGGQDLIEENLSMEKAELFFSSSKGNSPKKPLISFLQICPLSDLEGSSIAVQNKKKQLWEQLKSWKKLYNI